MTTPTVSLVDVSTNRPENRVSAEYYASFACDFAAAAAVRWGGRTK
jgi:hypothetical protein